MRAVVCKQYGSVNQLAIEEVEAPRLRPDSVRIGVKAASINVPDVLMPEGKYQVQPTLPFVLGLEGMGIVLETGSEVTDLRAGERVMAYVGEGCFAQEVVVSRNRVQRVPDSMSDLAASGFILTYSTAYHGLVDCGRLSAGETIVILGASGGIGLCAIQIARALDATVIAVASTEEKLNRCAANGAHHLIPTSARNLKEQIMGLTGGRGADVILDVVGGGLTDSALRAVSPFGRYLIAGYASGVVPMIKGNLVLLKQAQVIGVSYRLFLERFPERAAANLESLCQWYVEGRLQPEVCAEFPMERIVDALNLVGERLSVGKVAITL